MNLILITAFIVCIHLVCAQSPCEIPGGGGGECVSLLSCQPLLTVLNKKTTNREKELLKSSLCEYKNTAPIVCCPIPFERDPQEGMCETPEGENGKCISVYSCAHLVNMLRPPTSDEKIAYVRKSKCIGPEKYSVCCGDSPNLPEDLLPGNCAAKMTAFPPDPRTQCCGVQSYVPRIIFGGDATALDWYPWVVIIEYNHKVGHRRLLCGGVLISGKYVLTAGHCVTGQILNHATPRTVRLGEYDINNEGPDCISSAVGAEDCTDGVIRIDIEKTIAHPEYNPADSRKRNDIALIRLKETAPYTDFIRPVCLPTKDRTQPPNVPEYFRMLYAVGWGAASASQPYSNVKVQVGLPFVSQDKCQQAYNSGGRNNSLWKGQLCAGGGDGVDSCKGDSGGPLVYENGRIFEAIGVASFGPVSCGLKDFPGVYTNVYEYLDWIRNTIVS